RKILLLFTGTELANNRNLELFLREYAPLSAWSLGLAWILFPLAVVGAVRLVRRREGSIVARPVVVMAGVYALTIAAFFVTARYRVPLRPLAALFAVAGAIGLWEGLRSRSVAGLLPWVAFAGVLVAANGNSTVREVRAGLSPGQFFQSAAEVQAETGDFSRAAALQRRALEEDRALPDGFMNLGALLQQAGDPTGAIVAFRAEAARNPGNGRNLASLARVLDRQGEHEEAERIYAAAERTGWEDPPALFGHALVLDRMGRTDEAAELYRKVVELDPSHADAWNSLGVAEARAGRLEEAMALWNRALEAQPGFPRALDNLERARRRLEAPTR
ncbi:MAG: tetratricopeptide repeat protein, partial [Gemmatimonadota bacterium]|nr:tetratricopeptide repeat protein [Gemmatimonadota bacterium]